MIIYLILKLRTELTYLIRNDSNKRDEIWIIYYLTLKFYKLKKKLTM